MGMQVRQVIKLLENGMCSYELARSLYVSEQYLQSLVQRHYQEKEALRRYGEQDDAC